MSSNEIDRERHSPPLRNGARLALVVSRFPLIDETFILREMLVLDGAGYEFEIYTMKKPDDRVVHAEAQPLIPRRVYRNYLWSRELWRTNWRFLRRRPARYVGAVTMILKETVRKPLSMLKSILLFPKAVCYADLMVRANLTHIHAFWATFPATIAWIAHRLTGIPYSFSAHAHDIYEDDFMLATKLRESSFVMTCTAINYKHLTALVPVKAAAIRLIRHGLDLQPFLNDAQHHETDNNIFRILSIGTLYKTKGFDTLIEACALLQRQGIPFECRLVGDGPERQRLQRLIAAQGLEDRVSLLGYLTREQLRPLRRWADVFVLLPRPYLHWGLPNVYIEALAARLAVVATPLNAVAELIEHEKTGLVVESDNPTAAAAALLRLYREPILRDRLAAAGQKRVPGMFDAAKSAQLIIKLFDEFIEPSRATSGSQTARSAMLHP